MGQLAQQAPLRLQTTATLTRLLLAVIVAIVACVVACGGDDSPSPSPSPSATGKPTDSPTPTASPTPKGSHDFDQDEAMAMLRKLAVDIGIRAGGTDGERRAANYLRDLLRSWGYEAQTQRFQIQTYTPTRVELLETAPEARTLTPLALTNAATGTVEGEVALVSGLGEEGDFPATVAGRVAMIQRGTITMTEKVRNAEAAGAIGVIIYNNAPGNAQGTLAQPSEAPAVSISQEEGQALLAALRAGTVSVRISIAATINGGQSQNVIAKTPGSDCRVIVGGHYDGVPAGPGANDNGSGTVVVMEIARVLATRGETAHVCFTLFGSEELGLLGSEYYVSQLPGADRQAIVGYLNFDMFAVGTGLTFVGTDSLTALATQVADSLGVPGRGSADPPGVGSDHASFIQLGIPAILFNCFCDPNYHTVNDRIEFIVPERLTQAGEMGLGMVAALAPDP